MNTNPAQQLTKDIHIRISEQLEKQLSQIAAHNHLKPSTFARLVLMREIDTYIRNRIW